MGMSPFLRSFAAASVSAFLGLGLLGAGCGDDNGDDGPSEPGPDLTFSCEDLGSAARKIRFVQWDGRGGFLADASFACAFDRQVEPVGGCSLIVWDFPNNGNSSSPLGGDPGSNTFFQYEVGDLCLKNFDAQLDYTFQGEDLVTHNRYMFQGFWIRDFDSGTGPFATGTWQRVDANLNVQATACFDFYEDPDLFTGVRVCELP